MPISYKHKIIFIHIPKCAGTTIEYILDTKTLDEYYSNQFANPLSAIPVESFTNEEYRLCACKSRQHYTLIELQKCLPVEAFNSFKKIAIVRNPYERLRSEYCYVANMGMISARTSFEKFIKEFLSLDLYTRNWYFDGHLETQTSFLINKQGNFNSLDKIYHFEELDKCLNDMNNITGNKKNYHLRETNKKDAVYNNELKNIVYMFYKQDFINFNYSQ